MSAMAQQRDKPFVVGLTGGIGSGKTTVSDLFAALGAEVIDADVISRSLLQPGTEAFDAVVEHFGSVILRADGSLDRQVLRSIVFADPVERAWLEACLHPRIRAETMRRIHNSPKSWVLLSVPLLLEGREAYGFVDHILVVDVPEDVQLQRTLRRDGSNEAEVRAIMASQMPRAERLAHADVVLHNDIDLESLKARVAQLYQEFEELAGESHQAG